MLLTVFFSQCSKVDTGDDDSSLDPSTSESNLDTSINGFGIININLKGSTFGTAKSAFFSYFDDGQAYVFLFDVAYTCTELQAALTTNIIYVNIPYETDSDGSYSVESKTYTGDADEVYIFVQNGSQNSDGNYDFETVRSKENVVITIASADSSSISGAFDGSFESDAYILKGTSSTSDGETTVSWSESSETNQKTGPIRGEFTALYCPL